MRTIKLMSMCMLAAVLGMSAQSCSKDEYQTRIKELIINENNYIFDSDGGSYKREYRGEDLSCFKISSNADWCKAVFDFAKSTMTVTVDENETFDPRAATVTISDVVDGVSTRTFTVRQDQCDAIKTDESTYEVGTNGATLNVSFKTNVTSYKVQIIYNDEQKDWIIDRSKTRGLVNQQLPLEVLKNTSQVERSATVRIYDEESGVEDNVTIIQKFVGYMDIEKTAYEIDERGGTVTINVETNADFACYEAKEDTWAKKQQRQTISEDIIAVPFDISPFTEKKPKRVTSISFSNDYGDAVEVTITQTHSLYIEEASLKLLKEDSKTLTLVNDKKWKVTWSSSDESVATVDQNGKVTAVDGGGAIIKVTSEDGNHSDEVAVSVEKPADLKESLEGSNNSGYENVEGVKVMTSLDCTIINNSENPIQLNEVSLYCDGEYKKSMSLNKVLNKGGGSYTHTFDIEVEYEEIPDPEPDPTEEETTPTEEESTEGQSTDESSNGSRSGTRDDSEAKKKPKENTHKYQVVWDYTYGGENFKFTYPESVNSTRKASTRRASTRRR